VAGTLENPVIGEKNSTGDPKIVALVKLFNERLNSENQLGNTLRWYTPTVIATEQTRENTAFGALTTPDEVQNVILPENGLILVSYIAHVTATVNIKSSAAIFLGTNQIKSTNQKQETTFAAPGTRTLYTTGGGLNNASSNEEAFATTGEVVSSAGSLGGPFCGIFAAAGKYNVSIQYKALEGKVTAKERKLWVATLGA
jgi:hypothetical protein